jgi:hypothetical protein
MRYFLNVSTGRPVSAGGYEFEFEPVGLRGGSWLGVLAVADDAAASALSTLCGGTIDEISEDKYWQEKKKESALNASPENLLQQPRPSPQLAIANPVGLPTATTSTVKQNSTEMITPVTLLTTSKQPPDEPLLAMASRKPRPW